jgi:hypothetical protein
MATKTISLELDAYEKLRAAKKPGESFSEVVRRAQFPAEAPSGAQLLAYFRAGGSGMSAADLDAIEAADRWDREHPAENPWAE